MSSAVHRIDATRRREHEPSKETKGFPSPRTLHGLDWLNFFLADVQTGLGPFLAIYLAGYKWNEERVGLALTFALVNRAEDEGFEPSKRFRLHAFQACALGH